MSTDAQQIISYSDLAKAWQDSHISKVPLFVNHCYKTAMAYEKNQPGFINEWAGAFYQLVEEFDPLSKYNFQEVLTLGEDSQKHITIDNAEHLNGAHMLLALLCATLQQKLTLPEFAQLPPDAIEAEMNHILALQQHHRKQLLHHEADGTG
jgi:hypothetical protein